MDAESLIISKARFEDKSVVHKALRVPELLAAILTWLPRADLTRVARVCRFWSTLALDIIWEAIPELRHLFGTYSPLVLFDTVQWTRVWGFQDISGGGRWDVFWAYAQRVRTVEACDGLYTVEVVNHLKDNLRTPSCGPRLLPNLRSLSVAILTNDLHIFEALPIIPAGLRTLQVTQKFNISSLAIQRILKHLTAVPLDQLVDIEFSNIGRIASDASLSLCRATFLSQNRSTLAHLNLSIFPLTSEDLEHIGSFPSVIGLVLEQQGTSSQLSKFFKVIGSSFPSLRAIDVSLDDTIGDDISIAVIEGLAPCRELQNIFLSSYRWKSLTEQDVRELGRRWPVMESFTLYQAEYHPDQVITPLGILQDFAQVWSQTLCDIAMLFDTAAPLPGSSSVRFKFDKLGTLIVGWSPLHERNIDDVAEFLKAVSLRPLDVAPFYGRDGNHDDPWKLVKDRVKHPEMHSQTTA